MVKPKGGDCESMGVGDGVGVGTAVVVDVGVGDGVTFGLGVGEGVGVVVADAERLPSSFETKASELPPLKEVSYAPLVVGKSDE